MDGEDVEREEVNLWSCKRSRVGDRVDACHLKRTRDEENCDGSDCTNTMKRNQNDKTRRQSFAGNNTSGSAECPANESNDSSDMDLGDEMATQLSSISFKSDSSSKNSARNAYTVFPPLQRSGRKIDHLVEDVIRKSSRLYEGTNNQGESNFCMPAYVGSSPRTDSRFLSTPPDQCLSLTLRENDDPQPVGSIHTRNAHRPKEFSKPRPPPSYHLGRFTHSEWFDTDSKTCGSPKNSSRAVSYGEKNKEESSDDDYDEIYVD